MVAMSSISASMRLEFERAELSIMFAFRRSGNHTTLEILISKVGIRGVLIF